MGIACPFRFVSSLPGQWQFSVWKHQFSLPRFRWSANCALQHIDSSSLQKSRESDSRNCPGLPERNTQGPWTSVGSWPKFRPSKGVSPEMWWDHTAKKTSACGALGLRLCLPKEGSWAKTSEAIAHCMSWSIHHTWEATKRDQVRLISCCPSIGARSDQLGAQSGSSENKSRFGSKHLRSKVVASPSKMSSDIAKPLARLFKIPQHPCPTHRYPPS